MPKWEAASKEVAFLLDSLAGPYEKNLAAMNMRHRSFKIQGPEKYFPLPYALLGLPFVPMFAGKYSINHLFASPGEKFLIPSLSKVENSVVTITKDSATSLAKMTSNIKHFKNFGAIIVESQRHYDIFEQIGIEKDRLHLIYPGVSKYPYVQAHGAFKIFFASSPSTPHDFLSRGMYLLLQVAGRCPDVEFILAWRESQYDVIKDLIVEAGLANVAVKNGFIEDIAQLYKDAHSVILPGLAEHSFKPCPHSGLESLGHGKPVLVSRPSSISGVIENGQCGVVFNPDVDSLVAAIDELRNNYPSYQKNCQKIACDMFSKELFLEKYNRVYSSLLNEEQV